MTQAVHLLFRGCSFRAAWVRAAVGVACAVAFHSAVVGQAPAGSAPPGANASSVDGRIDRATVRNLTWRSIGPATTGGRVVDIAVVERTPDIIYAATASGGVWKTLNRGVTWAPAFDRETSVSVGAIAIAPSNPSVVWVGTGEANNIRSSSWGDGVYRSDDAGKTWKHLGLEGSRHVGRIVIHPKNPDIVYVAALGSLFGPNPERGLYKTTDGGTSWTKVLSASDHTGVVDVAMDPRDPEVLYAATFQRERRNWSFIGGGPEGGIFKSTDGGGHWDKLAGGLPKGDVGRIGLAICRSQPDRLYAAVVAPDGGIFRSDDRGVTWERRNSTVSTHWYYGQVTCDPNNPDRIYVPQTRVYLSQDGGRTFSTDVPGRGVHGDNHVVWIDPADSNHLLVGNDGGLYASYDNGRNWTFMSQMPIGQFYAIAADMQEPFYNVYGGLQDNSSWGGPSGTRNSDGITNGDWFVTSGGDGFYSQADPVDSTTVYSESQYGRLLRFDTRTGERRAIAPEPPAGSKTRWNWSAPLLISRHDHKTLYFGSNELFKSTDRGDTWKLISPDLTRQIDYRTLPLMGKIWEKAIDLHGSTADYGSIATIAESPRRAGLLAIGTDDGVIQVTRDNGATWSRAQACPGVPERTSVSRVILSHAAEGTMYATFDAHRDNDFRPYVCKSSDFGRTWTSIAATLPAFGSSYVIVEHQRNLNLLFVGTEFGVFGTFDGGRNWVSLKNNLPTVAVHDIVIHPRENDLIIGTHGRSIWILDDITALEELTPAVASASSHLFPIRPSLEFHRFNRGRGSHGQGEYVAANPPDGAIVTYSIGASSGGGAQAAAANERTAVAARVQIDILDSQGAVMRHLTGPGTPGLQRVVWDLRHEPPGVAEDRGGDDEGFRGPVRGPFVLPGNYRVQVKAAGEAAQTQIVRVKADPLIPLSDEERRAWHDISVGLSEMETIVRAALVAAQHIAGDANTNRGVARGGPLDGIAAILHDIRGEPARGIAEQPESVSLSDRIRRLYVEVEASTGLPTADQRRLAREAHDQLKSVVARLNHLVVALPPAPNQAPGAPLALPSDGWLAALKGAQP